MDEMNPYLIEQLERVMAQFHSMKKHMALEVACGEGPVTKSVFLNSFTHIDLFDQSPDAVIKSKAL